VKVYEAPDFRTLSQDVRRLFDTASDGFFNLPGWYDLVSRFSQRPDWRPKLVVNDAATAAFALQTNIRTGEAASLINPYTCAHDVIHGEDARAVRDLAHAFASAHPRPFRILLQGLDPESASFEAARSGLRDGGYRTKPFFCWGNWHETVSGKSFEDYLAGRPSSLVNTWRRKSATLEKTARPSFLAHAAADALEPFVADYKIAYDQSWKSAEPFPDFIPETIRFAASLGALRIGVLKIDGEVAASQFWIVWRGKALIFKLAHRDAFRIHSPGTLLTMHMLRKILQEDRPGEIDFGRGDDDYKKLWVSERRERWGIEAINPRTPRGLVAAGRMAAAGLRRRILGR
jgi:Acetyltransferase (GNAT) domain